MKRFPSFVMNRCACSALGLLVFANVLRATEPLLSFGPEVPIFLSLAGTVRHDDNIYLQKDDTTSDTIFVMMPGIDLHTAGGVGKADVAFSEQFVRYSSHSSLNSNLASLVGSAGYDGGLSNFGAKASYQEMDQSNLKLRNTDESVRRNLTDASVSGNFALAGKTGLGTELQYSRTVYPKVGFIDSALWSVPLDIYYALTAKTDLSVGYRFRRSTTEGGADDSKDHFFNLGARGQFTPKLSGQVRTGVSQRNEDRGGKDRQLGLDANLAYAYSPKSTFALQAGNGYSNSAYGVSQRVFSAGLQGDFNLTQHWSTNAGLSFESAHYLSSAPRRDRFWVANVGVNYALTVNSSAQLSYVFRKNASTAGVDFQGNVISFSVSTRF